MKEEQTEFDKLADTYFERPFETRALDVVIDFLSKTSLIVQSMSGYSDEFEKINLTLQSAVNIPESGEGYTFLQDVGEELLGFEDLEPVLGSEQEATEAVDNGIYCRSNIQGESMRLWPNDLSS